MKVHIRPSRLHGTMVAPPSKSMGHRLLICAALSAGTSTVHGISDSQDMLATLDCLAALGIHAQQDGCTVTYHGRTETTAAPEITLPCRESGSTLRFLIPLALHLSDSARFVGSERLMERGVGVYETLLAEKNCSIEKDGGGLLCRGTLTPGEYTLPGNVSSQFVSGLLFALPLLDGDSIIRVLPPVESRAYIDMTVAAMSLFGVQVTESEPNTFAVPGGQAYRAGDVTVEGDWSNAAFLYALRALGQDISVSGLETNSLQGDKVCTDLFKQLVGSCPTIDISNCPDLGPILFAVAAAQNGATFTGTRRLQIKESDRAHAMATELEKLGVHMEVYDNTAVVHKGTLKTPSVPLCGHNDHRIVMALSVLLSLVGGEITEAEAIAKSYPDFFTALEACGLEVTYDME